MKPMFPPSSDTLRGQRSEKIVSKMRRKSATHTGKTVSLRQARFLIYREKEIVDGLTSEGRSLSPQEIKEFMRKRRK
jgi:hypothetical protein